METTPGPEVPDAKPGVVPRQESARAQTPAPQTHGRQQRERMFEVASAVALALVAVATAWSGYQATRWTDTQSAKYAQASGQPSSA